MRTLAPRSGLVAMAWAAVIGLVGFSGFGLNSASAQTNSNARVNPNLASVQNALNQALVNQAALVGTINNPLNNPNYYSASLMNSGYGGYYNPYMPYYDPYGGALSGVADIVNAQGRFMINREQSVIYYELGRQAKIETRRKLFDELRYERENTPTVQELRELDQKTLYRRSVTNPPVSEIISGDSLNTLLDHLTKMQGTGARGPSVALDESTLKQVNVRPEGRTGNAGMLKTEGNIKWPLPLQGPEFEKERKRLEEFLPKAVQQARFQGVDAGTLAAIREDLEKLQERFSGNVNDLGTGKYIEGKRYLNSLDEAIQALSQPDATNYFNNKYQANGKTVSELVNYMKEKGLRFAPAVTGEEAAYRALHQAMVAYDATLTQVAANKEGAEGGRVKD